MLYGARALADWVLDGGRATRPRLALAARLRWHAFWFEQNWRTQAERLRNQSLPEDPVFIIGPWRSGTTALHELLAAATEWPTPATWQCFNPSTCFLLRTPPSESVTARPMDEGRISTRGPQEDEFAALLLGEPSVYRGFIDPRRLRACGAQLWDETGAAGGATPEPPLERWRAFLRGIAHGSATGRLLLKSPNHTFRLPLLRRWFPHAQFVWMGRRSQEVLASNVKMWRAMMARYALWSCPPGELETFLSEALQACASQLSRCLEELSAEQLLWVDFDDFRADPRRVLGEVLEFMHVADGPERDGRSRAALDRIPVHAGSRALGAADAGTERLDALALQARERFGRRRIAPHAANR